LGLKAFALSANCLLPTDHYLPTTVSQHASKNRLNLVGGSFLLFSVKTIEWNPIKYFCIHYAKTAAIIETDKELTYNKT